MIKFLFHNNFYIALFFSFVLGLGYWFGQRSVMSPGLRPAVMIQNLPQKTRKIKSITASKKTTETKDAKRSESPSQVAQESSALLPDPSELDFTELTSELTQGLSRLGESTVEELRRNIKVAEALIAKEPDLYLAHKSKLINLLVLEVRFGAEVSMDSYEDLYDDLLSFEGVNDNDEILQQARESQEGSKELESAELEGIDSDLMHVPFLRLSALNDFEGLEEVSEEYIEAFPDSYLGYVYLAESMWRQGDRAEATSVLQEGLKSGPQDQMVMHLFSLVQSSPLQRILKLSSY